MTETVEKKLIVEPPAEVKPAVPAPHCIAINCKSEKVDPRKGKLFCPVHALNVPRHLRKAIEQEAVWLQHKGMPADQHSVALFTVAMNREYGVRLTKDPLELARWMKSQAEDAARASAEKAGLLLPPKVGQVASAADIAQASKPRLVAP